MKLPLILINLKTYKQGTGKNALKLARICGKIKFKGTIAIAVQAADIKEISSNVKIPVFAQHIDAVGYGSNTGAVIAESVKGSGAVGCLVNHSEKRLRIDIIDATIKSARKNKLVVVVCANDSSTGKALNAFAPDFVAVEPPQLIGGKVSVCQADPKIISDSVKKVCGDKVCHQVLVGAGVHTNEDLVRALELGASGVLLASGFVKSKNPEKFLRDLVDGI